MTYANVFITVNNDIEINSETIDILHQLLMSKTQKKEAITTSKNLPLTVFCIIWTVNEYYDIVQINLIFNANFRQ